MLFGAAIAAATIYLAFLFWIAARRDRQAIGKQADSSASRYQSLIYGLSLAVYCTSWTFFGGVGTAANAGWDFLPIYLGPILVFTIGFSLVRRILAQAKSHHSTSIADFLSARYGKSAGVAALVTIIATIGSLPYMALQLQSVGNSLLQLEPELRETIALDEMVLLTAGMMALFAIMFGSRRVDQAGENAGLVLTIAIEAVVKLVALIALAGLALFALAGAPEAVVSNARATVFSLNQFDTRFAILTLIAACAALCLPRQFHMTFVEAHKDRADTAMRWVFPAYLVLISLVIIPIVLAGVATLPAGTNPDTIVMALPLARGNEALALLVFIGGFSASAGMIVVASVALSTMITNDLIAPIAFRREFSGDKERAFIAQRLVTIRRVVIGVLLALAYLFYLGFGSVTNLAGLGILAFAAAAQFAPGLVLGVLSRAGNRVGMLAGLAAGFLAWLILLIVPAATGEAPPVLIHDDMLVSGVLISLGVNVGVYWMGSAMMPPTLVDAAQAASFVGAQNPGSLPGFATNKRIADIRLLLAQFIGAERARDALVALNGGRKDSDPADEETLSMAERRIAGVIGSSSARMLVDSWVEGEPVPLDHIMAMFDETNRRLSFNGELLQIAIENIDQGVALVDSEAKLMAWNNRYREIFTLPDEMVSVGTPIEELIRFNMRQAKVCEDQIDQEVAQRLGDIRAGRRHRTEREQHDGRIMQILGNPAPGGGYVMSYTDVTAERRAEQALEEKVAERTAQLSEANQALEKATRSKTRFLAAASHDLIQPLNAARLFASALGEEVDDDKILRRLVKDLDGSIASADRLIRALLDISKLDGGGIEPKPEDVAINDVFDELVREFAVQAEAKGLRLRRVATSAWIETDRALLASVLRNLISNAVRYTDNGGVLIGVRRHQGQAVICVHDTGRGIAPDEIGQIFEEFQRGSSTDREGLGLGLAIVRRIASLLDMEIETSSHVGQGSRFAIRVPVLRWAQRQASLARSRGAKSALAGIRILVVDNDPFALTATAALLGKWGLDVCCAGSFVEAKHLSSQAPQIVIMDYRLDGDERGDAVYLKLCEFWNARPPAILLTAEAGEETDRAAERMCANRLLKPSSPAALRALIADCAARSAANVEDQDAADSVAG